MDMIDEIRVRQLLTWNFAGASPTLDIS